MKSILKQFGDRVRELRKAQGLSQEDLAEKASLHFTYVGGVERGERNLSLKSIEQLASALKIDIRELFAVRLSEKSDAKNKEIITDINNLLLTKDIKILQLIMRIIMDIDSWSREAKQ